VAFSIEMITCIIYSLSFVIIFFFMSKVNHSGPHHDRHKAYNDELNEPVYENIPVSKNTGLSTLALEVPFPAEV